MCINFHGKKGPHENWKNLYNMCTVYIYSHWNNYISSPFNFNEYNRNCDPDNNSFVETDSVIRCLPIKYMIYTQDADLVNFIVHFG